MQVLHAPDLACQKTSVSTHEHDAGRRRHGAHAAELDTPRSRAPQNVQPLANPRSLPSKPCAGFQLPAALAMLSGCLAQCGARPPLPLRRRAPPPHRANALHIPASSAHAVPRSQLRGSLAACARQRWVARSLRNGAPRSYHLAAGPGLPQTPAAAWSGCTTTGGTLAQRAPCGRCNGNAAAAASARARA